MTTLVAYFRYTQKLAVFIVFIAGEITASNLVTTATEQHIIQAVIAIAGIIAHYNVPNVPLPTKPELPPYAVDAPVEPQPPVTTPPVVS